MNDNEIRDRNGGAVRTAMTSTVMAGLVLAGVLVVIAALAFLTPNTTQTTAPKESPPATTGSAPHR